MTHIGIICPPILGHLNPMVALGQELQQRRHRVTFFQMPDIEAKVLAAGLEFQPIGQSEYPVGSMNEYFVQLSKLRGLGELRFTLKCGQRLANMICSYAPHAIKNAGVEILLVDQNEPAGGSVAEYLGIPFLTICNSLAINREADIPPVFTPWKYRNSWWTRLRNQIGYSLFDQIIQPINAVLNEYRRQWKLPTLIRCPDDTFSQFAQISQQPADFDFPRIALPACFHYVGPLRHPSSQVIPFPYEQLNGLPLIYASLGTLYNTKSEVFRMIAAACAELEAQLVISHGGGMDVQTAQALPGSPLVVSYAPQLELLVRAQLTITHAGLNTVLDSLSNGVPMVAIPMAVDQPAIAARFSWTRAGEVVPLSRLNVPRLRAAVKRVLTEDSYRSSAARLKASILRAGGVGRAADIVEQVIVSGKPVLANQG